MGMNVNAQKLKPFAKVESVFIEYKGIKVKAKKITVHTEISIDIDKAWTNVKTPALLQFVSKGMITLKSVDGGFPEQWEVGQTYGFTTRVFGIIPFGGIHYLFVEKMDDINYQLFTKEWDSGAKVWNHQITMRQLGDSKIYYEDAITIYGGILTGFIAAFAKRFYTHRQQRWQIVASNHLKFGK